MVAGKLMCPKCDCNLKRYDCVKRIIRHEGGKKEYILVERYQCPRCKSIHRILPNNLYPWDVWRDYIVLHACAISNAFDKENYERREKRYLDIIHRYGKEEQEIFPALAADTLMALNDNQEQDFLGKMFMDLGLSNHSNGQFFTPYHVCELMAELTMDDAVEKIEKQGYISINDPCCGAGATLIAGAHAIRKRLEKCEHPLNYQNHILMVGQDVDETVALMCYIQLSLLGLAGFIKIGNSITNPMSPDDSSENYWYTPMYFSDIWNTRRVIKSVTKLLEGRDQ